MSSNIESKVKEIIAQQLGIDFWSITRESTFEDLGADDLDTVELVMALEEEFHIEIPDEAAARITTVGQAIDYINSVLEGNYVHTSSVDESENEQAQSEIASSNIIGKTCPYCMSVIKPNVEVVVCPKDGVPHHKDCWEENGNKCTTYGCRGKGNVENNNQRTSQQDDEYSQPQDNNRQNQQSVGIEQTAGNREDNTRHDTSESTADKSDDSSGCMTGCAVSGIIITIIIVVVIFGFIHIAGLILSDIGKDFQNSLYGR